MGERGFSPGTYGYSAKILLCGTDLRLNARDIILREIISNTLAHRDYSSRYPARMIIDSEKIVIEN